MQSAADQLVTWKCNANIYRKSKILNFYHKQRCNLHACKYSRSIHGALYLL